MDRVGYETITSYVCMAALVLHLLASDGDINWMEYLMEGVVIPSFTSDSESEVRTCTYAIHRTTYVQADTHAVYNA